MPLKFPPLSALLLLAAAAPACADIALPGLFSNHAVLQRAARVPVWGKADPGEAVTVTLDAASGRTEAGPDGKWRVDLDLHAEGPGPFALKVEGKNKLAVADVLVGQVWVCSGQSNMEFPLSRALGSAEEISAPANPMLRQFAVKKNFTPVPSDACVGEWTLAEPAKLAQFTAVGYFFGKKLQHELGEPVGLINATLGGTTIEPWISSEGLDQVPELKEPKDKQLAYQKAFPAAQQDYVAKFSAWTAQYDRKDRPQADPQGFAAPGIPLDDWKEITLPGSLAQAGLPAGGAIWLRRQVLVPAQPPKALRIGYQLSLGNIHGFETVYWNGVQVGEKTEKTPGTTQWRRYGVPLDQLQLGAEATLAIRVYNPSGDAAIDVAKGPLNADGQPLPGPWKAKAEYVFPDLPAEAAATCPQAPEQPEEPKLIATQLYNAMIHPLLPYAIQGVTWYQGESNTPRAAQYRTAFPLLIRDWRAQWGQGDFPFYFCQLVNFSGKKTAPSESAWAELRESQAAALALPQTGMAVLIDIGEAGNIHPGDKRDAGERLAAIALAQSYGRAVPSSGPQYDGMQAEGGRLRLRFRHAEGGLVAKPLPASYAPLSFQPDKTVPLVRNTPDSQLEGFQVCGNDRQWAWAQASIEQDGTVLVSSPAVPAPAAVRYAWADNPTCNLYNGAGFPAAPFRTDDFPLSTAAVRFEAKFTLP